MYLMSLILFLTLSVVTVNSARILAWFPTPSISHQVVFRPVTQELAKRGHKVVVLTTDPVFPPAQAPKNLTEIDLHDISYNAWAEQVLSAKITTGENDDTTTQMGTILIALSKIAEMQWHSKDVQSIVGRNINSFDLLIFEACGRATLGLSHILKIPLIIFSSLGGYGKIYDVLGAPSRPVLLYPTPFRQKINNLSIVEKLEQLYNHYKFENMMNSVDEHDTKITRRIFGADLPHMKELEKNMDLLFLNVHSLWNLNRPVPPGVVYLGGMHQKPKKELPEVA